VESGTPSAFWPTISRWRGSRQGERVGSPGAADETPPERGLYESPVVPGYGYWNATREENMEVGIVMPRRRGRGR